MDINVWSLIIGIASLVVGIVSIVLAIVSMQTSKKESEKSSQNYNDTKKLLDQIKKVALDNQKSIGYVETNLENI